MKFDKESFRTPYPLARVIVSTADQFDDFERFVRDFRFMEEGVAVDVAAPATENLTREDGQVRANVDLALDEVEPQACDMQFILAVRPARLKLSLCARPMPARSPAPLDTG